MKNIRVFFLSENVLFLAVTFSISLIRRVFVMNIKKKEDTLVIMYIKAYLCSTKD